MMFERFRITGLSLVCLLGAALLLTGCDFDQPVEVFEEDYLQFRPDSDLNTSESVVFEAGEVEPVTVEAPVQLAGETPDEDVTASFDHEASDLTEGEHYNLLSDGTVTISAGDHFADIEVEFLAENFEPGDEGNISLELNEDGSDLQVMDEFDEWFISVEKEE